MFFTREEDTFCKALEVFRPCFSKPQWAHFVAYLTGLLLGEKGEKNIQDIAGNLLDGGHQSSLNRFITKPRWISAGSTPSGFGNASMSASEAFSVSMTPLSRKQAR